MTLPHEEMESLKCALDFLVRLTDSVETKRIPSEIRKEARIILRHYPGPMGIEMLYEKKGKK